ncbi:MAG: toll/interleukin-1 receptor domain-containing protein [Bryobacteraceae bacterium]
MKTLEVEQIECKPMRIFISHAYADKALASKFVDFLRLGAGISHKNIFYSSAKGTIRNGDFFVENIINELNGADIVIALLSRSYFASHFCLAEAGAALARKKAGTCDFFSFVIPPASFSDLDGMLLGVQSGSILDLPIHGDMKDRIQSDIPKADLPGSAVWDEKREEFLVVAANAASLYEAQQDLGKIRVEEYKWCWEPGSETDKVYIKSKIRVTFRNGLKTALQIESGVWESGSDGIAPYDPHQLLKWQLKPGDAEVLAVSVPAGSTFRTWIGLAENVNGEECLNRSGSRTTGTMQSCNYA